MIGIKKEEVIGDFEDLRDNFESEVLDVELYEEIEKDVDDLFNEW